MRRELVTILSSLHDVTLSLGVGLVDKNGLLIESCGQHAAFDPHMIAAVVSQPPSIPFTSLLGDELEEYVVIGQKYSFFVLCLTYSQTTVYAMTERKVNGGTVRYELRRATSDLKTLLHTEKLMLPVSKRLKQPRQFTHSLTLTKHTKRILQKR